MERWYERRSHVVSRGAIDLGTSLQKKEDRLTYLLFERRQPLALLQLIQLSLSNFVFNKKEATSQQLSLVFRLPNQCIKFLISVPQGSLTFHVTFLIASYDI